MVGGTTLDIAGSVDDADDVGHEDSFNQISRKGAKTPRTPRIDWSSWRLCAFA
jgi:hypothetical protein